MARAPRRLTVSALPAELPGADLVAAGVAALRRREFTAEALLVAVGAPRLRGLGLDIPDVSDEIEEPELALYAAVRKDGGGHSGYNALIRRLVSFERAADAALRRSKAGHRSAVA